VIYQAGDSRGEKHSDERGYKSRQNQLADGGLMRRATTIHTMQQADEDAYTTAGCDS